MNMSALFEDPDLEVAEDGDDVRLRLLWSSMLRLAVTDWVTCSGKHSIRKRSTWRDAHQWLFTDDRMVMDDAGVTFPAVCSALDLDPQWVRQRVVGLTENDVKANRPGRKQRGKGL